MNDHFATLAQPRRPWLDVEALKDAFHRATAQHHPDVAGGSSDASAALNAAYAILREPAARLRHLLELEAPEQLSHPQPISNELADFFMRLASLRQALDALALKESSASGALSRALLSGEKLTILRQYTDATVQLDAMHELSLDALRAFDAEWDTRPPDAVERLAGLHQRFAYLSKWRGQIREALFKLTS